MGTYSSGESIQRDYGDVLCAAFDLSGREGLVVHVSP